MKLSENLTLAEVTKSTTAIKNGISNIPSDEHLDNLVDIAQKVFQPIRDYFGVPIAITSGYRSEALNKLIGGSLTSQHSKGEALDFDADVFGGVTNAEIFDYIIAELDFDQVIWEFGKDTQPDWVHVSYKSEGNRRQVLQAYRWNGKTHYKPL
jgi:hypothetical protein